MSGKALGEGLADIGPQAARSLGEESNRPRPNGVLGFGLRRSPIAALAALHLPATLPAAHTTRPPRADGVEK